MFWEDVRYGYRAATTILECLCPYCISYALLKLTGSLCIMYALTNFTMMSECDMNYIVVY